MTSTEPFPSLHLAALAAASIPGLKVRRASRAVRADDVSCATIVTEEGKQYTVYAGHTAEASTDLLIESRVLGMLDQFTGEHLAVAKPAGRYSHGNLSAVICEHVEASPLETGEIESDAATRFLVGQALAAIHLIPAHELEESDIPYLEASEVRDRMLNLLDAAAGTGRVPSVLLSRWERVLDEAGLWRFTVTPVHGDLHEDRFHRHGDALRVTNWSGLTVGDPAEDFAWIMAFSPTVRREIFTSYFGALADKDHPRDTDIERRALFHAEFAVAEYLMTAVRQKDDERIEAATTLLAQLAERIAPQEKTQTGAPKTAATSGQTATSGQAAASGQAVASGQSSDSAPAQQVDATAGGEAESKTDGKTPAAEAEKVQAKTEAAAVAVAVATAHDATEADPATTLNPIVPGATETDAEGTDAEGSDAEGSHAEGSDGEGRDGEGRDAGGSEAEDSDASSSDASSADNSRPGVAGSGPAGAGRSS